MAEEVRPAAHRRQARSAATRRPDGKDHRKPLRPNELARWELRIGEFRVFYDVEGANVVKIKAIGWKEHNRLLIRGREYHL